MDNGKGGFDRFEFTCGDGTVWDDDVQTCNHPNDVKNGKCKSNGNASPPPKEMSTTERPQQTTGKYGSTTDSPQPTSTQYPRETSSQPNEVTSTQEPAESTTQGKEENTTKRTTYGPVTTTDSSETTTNNDRETTTDSQTSRPAPSKKCKTEEDYLGDDNDCHVFYR